MSAIVFLLARRAAAVPVAVFFSILCGRKTRPLKPGPNPHRQPAASTPPADFGLAREEHPKVGGEEPGADKGAAAAAAAGGALIIGYEATRHRGEGDAPDKES